MALVEREPHDAEDRKFSMDEWKDALEEVLRQAVEDHRGSNEFTSQSHSWREWMAWLSGYMSF